MGGSEKLIIKRKVCVVITARTSYTKIKPILVALKQYDNVELQIICAASAVLERYGNVVNVLNTDGFSVNECIYMSLESESLLTSAKSVGVGIIEFAGAFDRLKPDVVVVMADRFEVIAPSIASTYQNIPLAHIQGGEVTGNIDEKVRHSITKLADIHFPSTLRSKKWIIQMGENENKVFMTGCPSIDLAKQVVNNPKFSFDLYAKYGGVGDFPSLQNGYVIVMQHPVTTEVSDAKKQVIETLEALRECNKAILWFWPNPDAGGDDTSKVLRQYREKRAIKNIHFIKNMEPSDFLTLLYNSDGIIGNSSVAIRESSYLGVPAINIGTRQSNRERAINVVDTNYDRNEIKSAIVRHFKGKVKPSYLYGKGKAGLKIADILSSIDLSFSKKINYID
ncbi:UDP-N-acetylglucosamine 2-epimerase [Aquirufa antheringensis]